MRILTTIIFILTMALSAHSQEVWQLQPWPLDSNYVLGATAAGEPTWVHKDSLGVRSITSIYIDSDSLYYVIGGDTINVGLATSRDSTVIIGDYGVTAVETSPNTWTLKADTSEVATPFDLTLKENPLIFTSPLTRAVNTVSIPAATTSVSGHLTSTDWNTFNGKVGGTGTATRVAFWNSSNTISSNANFFWDNTNNRLGINKTPGLDLDIQGRIGLNGAGGAWNTFINGGNTTLSGAANMAIGSNQTLSSISTGSNNVAIGNAAGNANTTGSNNFYLGNLAGFSNISSSDNTFIGGSAGFLTTGGDNTYVGSGAGRNSTTGAANVSIGTLAGYSGGTNNTNIGFYSGFGNTGEFNVRIGRGSGQNSGAANYSTYIGGQAGQNNTGSENVCIGLNSGQTGDGSNNVFIGARSGQNETGSNRLYIENSNTDTPLIGGHFDNNRVGINTLITDIGRTLDINGEVRIRDLTTTTPTRIVSADADGVISSLGLSGLSISGGNLTVTATTIDSTIVTGGTGISVNESPLNTFTVTNTGDLSSTNEGVLGVGIGTGSSSIITSNTSGSPSVTLAAGSGIGISESGTTITIENTAPAQEVTIDGFGISVVGGSYPDFTITSTEVDGVIGNEYNTSMSSGFIGILPALSITDGGGTLNGSIPLFSTNSSNAAGVVPGSDGSTSKFLNASGIWMAETGDISAVTVSSPITGGGTTGSVNIGIDTTSSTGVATQYDLTQIDQDQVVSLTGGGITSITGTYPNFTVTSTEVDGSITNEIQDLSLSGNTLSLSGDATTVDLSSFAGNGTVTSVGIVNGGGLTVSGSPITTSGNITITAADQSASNEYNTSVTSTYVGNLPAITITDGGGAKTGVVQVFSSNFSNYGSVPGANGATTSFLRGDGVWAMPPSSGITSLGGQIGATQTFAYGTFGTTPSWSSSTNTHTFRLPAGSNGQVLKHNGTDWTVGADAGALSGTINTIPYYNSTTSIASTPFTYGANTMTIPSGNSIYFPGTATIIDKNNSGGAANEILSRASSGGGMDWIPAPTGAFAFGVVGNTSVIATDGTGLARIQAGTNISASNSGGTVTVSTNVPFAQLKRDGSLTVTWSNTWQKADFNATDNNGVTVSSTTDQITVPSTGMYEINFGATCYTSATTGSNSQAGFRVQNTTLGSTIHVATERAVANEYFSIGASKIVSLTAGHILEMQYSDAQMSGTATGVHYYPYFSIKRIN